MEEQLTVFNGDSHSIFLSMLWLLQLYSHQIHFIKCGSFLSLKFGSTHEKQLNYWSLSSWQRLAWHYLYNNFYSFNATLMLETLRGKRMMFVGDSLNRGQYVSLVCLLHRSIPENAKSMKTNGSLTVFTAKVTLISYLYCVIEIYTGKYRTEQSAFIFLSSHQTVADNLAWFSGL